MVDGVVFFVDGIAQIGKAVRFAGLATADSNERGEDERDRIFH